MKKLTVFALGGSLLLAGASASAEISGNVSIGTDYIYRGISQTEENPTVQGGFDWEDESGFYAGVWGSNVDFDGSVELDFYAGFGGSFSEGVDFDLGLLRYEYPGDGQDGAPDSSFNEVYGSVSFSDFSIGLAYSPDFFGETGSATYISVDYSLALPNDFSVGFHFGDQTIDDADDYNDYSIGISKTFSEIDVSLTWFDTDISNCDICDARVVFAVGKSL